MESNEAMRVRSKTNLICEKYISNKRTSSRQKHKMK